MKKILLFTAAVFLFSYSAFAQKGCRESVRNFYHEIFAKNLSVIKFGETEYPTALLCLGSSKSQIEAAIDSAKIYSDGSVWDSIVEVRLSQGTLFFTISVDDPNDIAAYAMLEIFDSNGAYILSPDYYLRIPAIINDPDGYVNIRKEKNAHSPIVGKIKRNQIFFFTPSGISNWYRVYITDGGQFRGYVHKSRILPYEKCPENIKKQMERMLLC